MLFFSNFANHFSRNNSLYNEVGRLHLAHFNTVSDDVIEENETSLVTINQNPFALVVLTSHSHTVGIGIGSHHNICIERLSITQSKRKGFTVFWVRRNNRRKITASFHLFFHTIHVFKAPKLQRTGNEHHTRSVERRVDYLQIFLSFDNFGVDRERANLFEINLVYLFTDGLDKFFVSVELNIFDFHFVYFVDDSSVVRCQDLCAVFPISLVSVVFFGIMRGRNVHTCLTMQVSDGERTLRRGAHIIENVGFDAIG